MRTALVFVVGGMVAWTASAFYFVPQHERALVSLEEQLGAERTARHRAETRAATAEVEHRRALVEMDRIRRAFFNLRNSWCIPAAAVEPDTIPATKLPTKP